MLQHHIGRHDVDPTLVALIKNFVPGMRQIELKKDCCGRDKKGQADKNRKKNHAQFLVSARIREPLVYICINAPTSVRGFRLKVLSAMAFLAWALQGKH